MNVNPEKRILLESRFLRVTVLGGTLAVAAVATVVGGPHLVQHALEAAGNFLMQNSAPINLPPIHGGPDMGEVSGPVSQQVQHLAHVALEHVQQ